MSTYSYACITVSPAVNGKHAVRELARVIDWPVHVGATALKEVIDGAVVFFSAVSAESVLTLRASAMTNYTRT